MRRALTYLFLCALLFELSHPSSNFVRTHVAPDKQGLVLAWGAHDDAPALAADLDPAERTAKATPAVVDSETHAADAAYRIVIELEQRHPSLGHDEPLIHDLNRPYSVFQPPKRALA